MRNKRLSTTVTHRMQDQAKRLINRIFRHLPCVMCLSLGRSGERVHRTIPAHILNKGMFGQFRYVLLNLLPMCDEHHTKGKAISMHAWGGDTTVIANFYAWLENTLPKHYQWYLEKKDDRGPHKVTLSDLSWICEDLKYLADNPAEAEKLIYEK